MSGDVTADPLQPRVGYRGVVFRPFITAELEVFEATSRLREEGPALLEEVRQRIVVPMIQAAAPGVPEWPPGPFGEWDAGAARGAAVRSVGGLRPGHEVVRVYHPSEESWRRALRRLADGGLASANLETYRVLDSGYWGEELCDVAIDLHSDWLPGDRDILVIILDAPAVVAGGMQEALVAYFLEAASRLGAERGRISLEVVAYTTAHEEWLCLPGQQDDIAARRGFVRGYDWGTLLWPAPIAALGGPDRIAAEAPVQRVVPLSTVAGERIFLQLTERLEALRREDLVPLRRWLAPVLVPPRPQPLDQYDTRSRPPVWWAE